MRRVVGGLVALTFLYCLASLKVWGQGVDWLYPCGTDTLPPSMLTMLRQKPIPLSEDTHFLRTTPYYLPLALRVLCRDDSTGCLPLSTFLLNLCEAHQEHFGSGNMFFVFLLDEIRWYYNTQAYDGDASLTTDWVTANMTPERLNVFIMGSNSYCGISSVCGCMGCCASGAVTVAMNCMGFGQNTFSHEVGHWLGLPHTFAQINNCKECVDRSNCYSCGDLFCDTEADYLHYPWMCPYQGDSLEPVSCPPPQDTLEPDATLLMSYAYKPCRSRFSAEQKAYMRYVIQNSPDRQWILSYTLPVRLPPDPVTDVSFRPDTPSAGSAYVIWRGGENATHFLVEVYEQGNSLPVFERLVSAPDSFVKVSGLQSGQRYKAVVRPLNELYFCTAPAETPWVPTQDAVFQAWAELSYIPCTEEGGATVTIHARLGQPPYVYWHAETGWRADSVFCRLPGGWHTFKVRDQSNSQITLSVWIDGRLVVPDEGATTGLSLEGDRALQDEGVERVLVAVWEGGVWRLPVPLAGWVYTLYGRRIAYVNDGRIATSLPPGMYWLIPMAGTTGAPILVLLLR